MSLWKLEKELMSAWVERVLQTRIVYGPQARANRFAFGRLENSRDLRLDHDVTMLPPKKYFQPQSEELLAFDAQGESRSVLGKEEFVLFGVHPYDVAAVGQMDTVFASDNCDVHYLQRRQGATIVACDVQTPSADVFAACMGTATVQSGFDILLTLVGGDYIIDSRTEKGAALLRDLPPEVQPADAHSLARREQVWDDARRFLKKHVLNCKYTDLPGLLAAAYDHPVWEQKSARCYSCSSCNMVCPTCYCFEMRDDFSWNLDSAIRRRTWDGCMLAGFALVAGGHNFRKTRMERFRHRLYRKGKYLSDRFGQIACVGCGRCVTACTTDIANPVKVYNSILAGRAA